MNFRFCSRYNELTNRNPQKVHYKIILEDYNLEKSKKKSKKLYTYSQTLLYITNSQYNEF